MLKSGRSGGTFVLANEEHSSVSAAEGAYGRDHARRHVDAVLHLAGRREDRPQGRSRRHDHPPSANWNLLARSYPEQPASRTIHAIRKSTIRTWRSGGISVPLGTFHHFARQPRQQHAQACCALKTGCPRIGVCRPSFGGFAGARRVRMKSSAWRRIVSMPFSAIYRLSANERWNRDRNFERASRWKNVP